jgi:hypothetical protein
MEIIRRYIGHVLSHSLCGATRQQLINPGSDRLELEITIITSQSPDWWGAALSSSKNPYSYKETKTKNQILPHGHLRNSIARAH